ncbi:MAG: RNA 3'-terminal phosphate cyclase [Methylohalobius sp.]|nr:RNA 3'-terminal phosphate cyclase [Methylohalobius sp.]
MTEPLPIDGSYGEGGGQILRTALALSVHLKRPIHLFNLRAHRDRPGLRRQHLSCVLAAAEISQAEIQGAEIGSREIYFAPRSLHPGRYTFDIGTAGSTTLLLQTLLLPLLLAEAPSRLILRGGTHNSKAPPFEFLAQAFLPLLARMGGQVNLRLERPGFYPRGGGILEAEIEPVTRLQPLTLPERGQVLTMHARALVADLPRRIAEREIETLAHALGLPPANLTIEERPGLGPGNVVIVTVRCEHLTEVFTGFGERRVRAETVADHLATEVKEYLATGAAVGPHLADQLLLPLALAGGGRFLTTPPTLHTTTNIWVIEQFLPLRFHLRQENHRRFWIELTNSVRW